MSIKRAGMLGGQASITPLSINNIPSHLLQAVCLGQDLDPASVPPLAKYTAKEALG